MAPADSIKQRLESAYDSHADMLYRLALTHLGSREDAEDAVQDVFARYVSRAPLFANDEHERAWLIRVTINRCHDLARRRSVRTHEALDEVHDLPDIPKESESSVIEALGTVPEKYRTAITLHHLEGFSVDQTAAILKVSVSAVKMRLSRGRDMLKALLEKEDQNV